MAEEQAVRECTSSLSTREREARKWLLGTRACGVAAVITSYVTGGITSGVDRVRGSFEEEPAPLELTVTHSAKEGSGDWVLPGPIKARSRHFLSPRATSERSRPGMPGHTATGAWTDSRQPSRSSFERATSVPGRPHRAHGGRRRTSAAAEGRTRRPVRRRALQSAHFSVDLDESPPTVESWLRLPSSGSRPAGRLSVPRLRADPWVFYIVASAREVRLHVASEPRMGVPGEEGLYRHRRRGQPFRTVSPSKSVDYFPEFDRS